MQESEFTGCVNKVQGRPSAGGEKHGNHELFKASRKNFPPATLTLCAASCTINWVRALSSAVRAFGLHPKGRPFKSDSAHHCDATPFSGDVVQLVRALPFCCARSRRSRSYFDKSPLSARDRFFDRALGKPVQKLCHPRRILNRFAF